MISFDLEILFKCVVIRSSRVCRPAKIMLKNGQVQKSIHKIFESCSFYQIFLHIKAKRCGNILKLKESLVVRKSDQIMKLKLGDRIRHTYDKSISYRDSNFCSKFQKNNRTTRLFTKTIGSTGAILLETTKYRKYASYIGILT